MNKIFKVVWNKARGCYVVASEFAKSRTKSGRAAKAAVVAVVAALTLGMNGLALAANGDGTEYSKDNSATATNETDIAVGNKAKAGEKSYTYRNDDGEEVKDPRVGNSTAVGDGAIAEDYRSTAIGSGAYASGELYTSPSGDGQTIFMGASTAVGSNAKATNHGSTALGSGVQALGEAWTVTVGEGTANPINYVYKGVSTAIGHGSVARMYASISVGDESMAYGARSIAMGSHAQTGLAIKADGYKDEELKAANVDGIAIGTETVSSGRAATALGARADAFGEAGTAVGASSIANGRFSAAFGAESKAYGENGVAIGNGAQTGLTKKADREAYTDEELKTSEPQEGGTAVGTDAEASGRAATALGARSTASAEGSTSLGASSVAQGTNSTALGVESKATGIRSTTVGYKSTASKANSTALGYYSQATGYASTAVGTAIDEKDFFTKASGERSTALGASAQATERASTATGANSQANGVASAAFGYKAIADKNYALAAGYNAHAYAENNVALGASSDDAAGKRGYAASADSDNAFALSNNTLSITVGAFEGVGSEVYGTVSVGYTDKSGAIHTRTITNVAAGLIAEGSTDAINGSQLYAVADAINTKVDNLPGQFHTVNGNDKDSSKGETADAPVVNSGKYVGGNLLIKADEDEKTGDITYDISLNKTLTDIDNIEINNGITIGTGDKKITINKGDVNFGGNIITNVVTNSQDGSSVVNVDYLQQYVSGTDHKHTVNGKYKTTADAPIVDGDYVGDNLLIKATKDDNGIITYDISLNKTLTDIDNIEINNGITIGTGDKKITINENNVNFGGNVITNVVTNGGDSTSVVNVGYLEQYINTNVKPTTDTDTHIEAGEYHVGEVTLKDGSTTQGVQMDIVDKDGKLTGETVTITDVAKASDVTKIQQDITNIDNRVTNIENKIDGAITEAGKHTQVTVNGDTKAPSDGSYTNGNLQLKVDEVNGQKTYDIKLNNELDLGTKGSVTIGNTKIDNNSVNIGSTTITENKIDMGDTHITNNSVTTTEVTTGNTTINNSGLTIKGDTEEKNITINQGDVSMGGNKITNVAVGTEDNDAVNYSQLKELDQHITNNSVQINKLGSRIDKVGAGAAALAALHPLDFDPDDKLYLSAGYGNYRGENAVAVGAFYQPNDDTLFSVSSTVGNDDDMINAGVTWRFGQSSHQSRSKKAMAKEIIELRTRLAALEAMIYSMAGAGLDPEKSKLFPDTPENHWAYDYVAVVAGNGILEGYPDGYFDGERPMTRYEMAAVVYRLLQKGVQVNNRMIQEFAPELARVRVDTLTHYNDGTPHIQRVRVIKDRG